jgi:hypothetical protein
MLIHQEEQSSSFDDTLTAEINVRIFRVVLQMVSCIMAASKLIGLTHVSAAKEPVLPIDENCVPRKCR